MPRYAHLTDQELVYINKHREMIRRLLHELLEDEVLDSSVWLVKNDEKAIKIISVGDGYEKNIIVSGDCDNDELVVVASIGSKETIVVHQLPLVTKKVWIEDLVTLYCLPEKTPLSCAIESAVQFILTGDANVSTGDGVETESERKNRLQVERRRESEQQKAANMQKIGEVWESIGVTQLIEELNKEFWNNSLRLKFSGYRGHYMSVWTKSDEPNTVLSETVLKVYINHKGELIVNQIKVVDIGDLRNILMNTYKPESG